jgi:hypothetical protein
MTALTPGASDRNSLVNLALSFSRKQPFCGVPPEKVMMRCTKCKKQAELSDCFFSIQRDKPLIASATVATVANPRCCY